MQYFITADHATWGVWARDRLKHGFPPSFLWKHHTFIAPGNYSLFPFGAGFGVWGSVALGIRQSISRLFVGFVEFCKEHFLKISEGGQPIQFWKPNGLATKISTRTKARSLNLTWFGSFCLLAISFYLLASQCLPLGQWAGIMKWGSCLFKVRKWLPSWGG